MTATSTIPPVGSYAPDVVVRAPAGTLSGASNLCLGIGALGLLTSFIGLFVDREQFFFSYMVAYMFTLSLALGALFFVLVQHVTRAGWSIVVRRVAENAAATMPLMLLLFVPILLDCLTSKIVFHHWLHANITPGTAGYDELVASKSPYLNLPFFLVRAAIYFAVWIGLTRWFRGKSIQQDENGDPALSLKMAWYGAPALMAFGLTITFAAIDWMMSISPHWFSTMYGVTYFAASEMTFLAFLALLCMGLARKGLLKDVVNTEHYHDIGKLMFAFLVFWAYVNFSQYFLIQYADLPEETGWYRDRQQGNWEVIGTVLVFGHFLLPFAFLLSRHVKRNRTPLALGAALLVVMHWVDMKYQIMPGTGAIHDHFAISWLDVTTLVGVVGLFLGLTLRNIAGTNLIPVRDPKLRESLHFHNI